MQTIEASAASVQQPTLRGRQSVAAIWFPRDWFDSITQARRIVACWRTGATAMRFARGDLLRYPVAIDMDCHMLPGWPLRHEGRALSTAALTARELATAPDGDVLIVSGAEIMALNFSDAVPLDPASWLDVARLTLHETYDCTTPPPAPIVLDLDARSVREVLGDAVPPASVEQSQFIEAIRKAQHERAQKTPQASQSNKPADSKGNAWGLLVWLLIAIFVMSAVARDGPGAFALLCVIAILTRLFIALARGVLPGLIRSVLQRVPSGPVFEERVAAPTENLPARRNTLTRPQRWRQLLARWSMTLQLSRLIGRAQARYMRRMLGLFEDGNLEEALRHAIPLGGDSLGQSFGTP